MKLNVELSRRETEVAHLLAWGASKKEVADILFISTRTVDGKSSVSCPLKPSDSAPLC